MTPIDPDPLDALLKRGNTLEASGDLIGALALYDEAARLAPKHSRPQLNRGNALSALGRHPEAEAALQQAYALGATASARLNLGNLYLRIGRLTDAATAYAEALELRPGWDAAGFGELCVLYASKSPNLLAAIERFRTLHPGHADARRMQLQVLSSMEPEQVLAAVEPSCCTDPKPLLLRSSANAALFDHDSAMADRWRAVESDPTDLDAICSLAFATMTYPSTRGSRGLFPVIQRAIPAEAVRTLPLRESMPYRIGYLSADYDSHPATNFIIPMFLGHRRERFVPIALSNLAKPDEVTTLLKSMLPEWIDLSGLDDEAAEARVCEAQLDVVVDLSGWTHGNRLRLLARRVAPVQLTAVGTVLTTGVPAIDFRICDIISDPPGLTEDQYSETLLRMDGPQGCYHELRPIPASAIQPARFNEHFTFGYFNSSRKITREMVEQWITILHRVPTARFKILGVQPEASRRWLMARFSESGLAERVSIQSRLPITEYHSILTTVDVALDSYPYNGGTTTIETLLAGVPVLSRCGPWSVSRCSRAVLEPLGLYADWVVGSAEAFVDRAVQVATGPMEPLEILRAELPRRVRASRLMNRTDFIERWEATLLKAIELRRAAIRGGAGSSLKPQSAA